MSKETTTADDTTADDRRNAFGPALGRYFPEALVAAVFLAVVSLVATTPYLDPVTQVEMFGTGFFQLFTTQMLLILFWVLGAAVVVSVRFGALLDRIASVLPTSQNGIIYTTAFVSLLLGWINWAFGLIGGILIGQRLCRRARENGTAVHYPLVLTGGLLALVIMNQGLSSPGALIMADDTGLANFMVDDIGSIALAEFIFHPVNLISSVVFVLTLPLVLVALSPDDEYEIATLDDRNRILTGSISETFDHYTPGRPPEEWELGDRLENAQIISLIAVVIGFSSILWHFANGGDLTFPWLAFTLMMLGLLTQIQPMAFREKTEDTTKWANHMAIPFLLYAAVFALLNESGLYGAIGDAIAGTGIPHASSFVIAFLLGLLVPDPGSLWVMQGPALAAAELDVVVSLIAVMYGAGISNLWLAFLFSGILSIYGFDWREFARYAGVITLYMSAVVLALLAIF